MLFGECDNCGKKRLLRPSISYGIETAGCTACHGEPLANDADDLSEEIVTLIHEHMPPEKGQRLLAVFAAFIEALSTETRK